MKYLVMENHESHSIVMDESGIFYRIANLGYEIGETVTDPVFMKTPEKQQKHLNWKKLSTIAAIFICFLLAGIPFVNNYNESDLIVHMSINPEVHLELNQNGEIKKIVADNEDGKILLEGYVYKEKTVSSVLVELIDRAAELEFLRDGGDIQITVSSEKAERAKTVSVDLGELLNDTYVKKYLIKIRVNDEEFHDIEEVVNMKNSTLSSETETTTESERAVSYNKKVYYYTHGTEGYSEPVRTTEPTPDDLVEESSSVEISQPSVNATSTASEFSATTEEIVETGTSSTAVTETVTEPVSEPATEPVTEFVEPTEATTEVTGTTNMIPTAESEEVTETTEAEATGSSVLRPIIVKPTISKPVISRPVITKPTTSKPTVLKPTVTKPTILKPVETRPVITKPTTSKPTVSRPTLTKPTVSKSAPSESSVDFTESEKQNAGLR